MTSPSALASAPLSVSPLTWAMSRRTSSASTLRPIRCQSTAFKRATADEKDTNSSGTVPDGNGVDTLSRRGESLSAAAAAAAPAPFSLEMGSPWWECSRRVLSCGWWLSCGWSSFHGQTSRISPSWTKQTRLTSGLESSCSWCVTSTIVVPSPSAWRTASHRICPVRTSTAEKTSSRKSVFVPA